jgi:catechol 2,3-dioxygenase-like lactoylglutathione lyase family enzyme
LKTLKRQHIGYVALLVRDYDEAKDYYINSLGLDLVEDSTLADGKRWLLVAPPGSSETRLLLAEASGADQVAQIGRQAGGRVFLFLHTDDFWRDFSEFTERGVRFCEAPRDEPYGTVAVFEDLYGNRWDLVQIKSRG